MIRTEPDVPIKEIHGHLAFIKDGQIVYETGCDPKMGLRCISLRLLICRYVRSLLVVRIAQNAVDFSVFKGVGSQILGDRRLA